MEDIVKNYLLSHSIEEITLEWKKVQGTSKMGLKAWFEFLKDLEKTGDDVASYLLSTALRDFFTYQPSSDEVDMYSDKAFEYVKNKVKEGIKYDIKHSRGEDRKFYENINLEEYHLV